MSELDPLPPDLLDLLDAERRRPEVPAAEIRRGLADVLAAAGTAPATAATQAAGLLTRSHAVVGIASLLVGVGIGAVVRPYLDPPSPTLPITSSVTPATPATPPPAVPATVSSSSSPRADTASPSSLPQATPSTVRPVASSTSSTSARPPASAPPPGVPTAGASSLGAERAFLETARSALARGDGTAALQALSAHEASHAAGQLREERDALFVQALVAAGRAREAADRAGRFRLEHPSSVFLPVVDAALR